MDCSLQVGGELLSQARELKYGGDNGAWDGRAVDKAHDLPVLHFPTLTCYRELWTMAKRMISWIQAAGMSFLQRVAGHSEIEVGWGAQTSGGSSECSRCSLFFERSQLRCVGNLIRMLPRRLPLEVFWARTHWGGLHIPSGLGMPQDGGAGYRGFWNILLRLLSRPDPGIYNDNVCLPHTRWCSCIGLPYHFTLLDIS